MHDQAENLRNKLKAAAAGKAGKTIAIVSGKGGVGKSNFALNFALGLTRQGKKVLILDLDIGMGNIDVLLGHQSRHHIADLFHNHYALHELVEHGPEGLDYISGGSGLGRFFEVDDQQKARFYQQYETLSKMYDFVLFDMGAGATKESIFFILACDECIIIATPEPTALTDAYGMVKHILNNSGKMPIKVVMNRSISDKIGYKALEGLQEVAKRFLQTELFVLGVLPEDPVVQKAVMRQTPYMIYKDNAAVSLAMQKLTASYLGQAQAPEVGKGTTGSSFLSKLKQLVKQRGDGYGNQSNRNR